MQMMLLYSIDVAGESTNRDLNLRVKPWCSKWNMSMAADKTDVVVVTPDGNKHNDMKSIKLGEEKLKVVKSKKVLGVIIVNQLNVHEHIQDRVRAGIRALKSLDNFAKGDKGCCQSIFLHLYNLWYSPVMDFGASVAVTATSECVTEMGKVHRAAMLKASGCIRSTSRRIRGTHKHTSNENETSTGGSLDKCQT